MRAEQWNEIDEIVAHALELENDARQVFVDSACEGRPDIASEVRSLLHAGASAGDFLECHTLVTGGADEVREAPMPLRVGPYSLIAEVGHGGMSVVYRAERDDGQFRKQAAVKLLASGWIAPEALRRFLAERQILASLDHPNICRLLDGGVTAEGAPYLVMDFVDGMHLLDYCREHNLDQTQRLQLFRGICGALQYAHQNLVVHRDIKPGNVMVTRKGEVKLMDFGIARVLAEGVGAGQTQSAFAAMTPDYASPEQIRGAAITTQSDIYSLGVLLYELLSGRRPYAASGKSLEEMLQIVSVTEAPAVPGLAPELVAIIRCAMCKEPGGRYASVSAMDDDVDRYLSGRPVRAVIPSRFYSLRKWIGRHRVPVLAGAGAAVMILSAMILALWSAGVARRERALAEQRFRDVRQLANKVMFDYPDALMQISAATDLRVRMATDSLGYLDALARSKDSDPQLLLELAHGYEAIGRLLGTPRNFNVGHPKEALGAFQKGRRVTEDLLAQHPGLLLARLQMARLLRHQSLVDPAQAEALAGQALSMSEVAYRESPKDKLVLYEISWAHLRLAELKPASGQAQLAVGFLEALAAVDSGNARSFSGLAYAHRLATRYGMLQNDDAGALAHAEKAKALDERAAAMTARDGAFRLELSLDQEFIAECYMRMKQLGRARPPLEEALRLRRMTYKSNSADEWVQHRFLWGLCALGSLAEQQGDWATARSLYHEAAELAPTLSAVQSNDDWNEILGFTYASEGLMVKRQFRRQEAACALFQKAESFFRKVKTFVKIFDSPDVERRAAEVPGELQACS